MLNFDLYCRLEVKISGVICVFNVVFNLNLFNIQDFIYIYFFCKLCEKSLFTPFFSTLVAAMPYNSYNSYIFCYNDVWITITTTIHKYLRQTLGFMWISALREKFNFFFSAVLSWYWQKFHFGRKNGHYAIIL